jgi:hypothetical protein
MHEQLALLLQRQLDIIAVQSIHDGLCASILVLNTVILSSLHQQQEVLLRTYVTSLGTSLVSPAFVLIFKNAIEVLSSVCDIVDSAHGNLTNMLLKFHSSERLLLVGSFWLDQAIRTITAFLALRIAFDLKIAGNGFLFSISVMLFLAELICFNTFSVSLVHMYRFFTRWPWLARSNQISIIQFFKQRFKDSKFVICGLEDSAFFHSSEPIQNLSGHFGDQLSLITDLFILFEKLMLLVRVYGSLLIRMFSLAFSIYVALAILESVSLIFLIVLNAIDLFCIVCIPFFEWHFVNHFHLYSVEKFQI